MKKIICAVFDKRAELFSAPFTSLNEGMALRDFQSAVTQSAQMNQFAEDYQLFQLAEFDDESGRIVPLDFPALMKG